MSKNGVDLAPRGYTVEQSELRQFQSDVMSYCSPLAHVVKLVENVVPFRCRLENSAVFREALLDQPQHMRGRNKKDEVGSML